MRIEPSHILKLISQVFPGPILYVDKDLRYLYANDAAADWFGLAPNELIGKQSFQVIDPEAFKKREPYLRRALAGEKVKFIAELLHPKLGIRYLEHTYEPDVDETGNVVGVFILAYDLTEQKVAEQKVLVSETRYKTLTEMMPQLVWETDASGSVTWMNDNWFHATGTTAKDNLNNGWVNLLHPEDREKTHAYWMKTLQLKSEGAVEYRLKMADGSYRWHIARGTPVRDEAGNILRWVGTTTDIDDQKHEEDRLFSLLMQVPLPIVVFKGPDFVFDFLNTAAHKYNSENYLGFRLFEALPVLEEQGFKKILTDIYETGKGAFLTDMQMILPNPDGSQQVRYFDFFYEPLKDETGKVHSILNISIDVTEKRLALNKAEEALQARDQFLSIASHELKTPLTSLKLQSQYVLKTIENGLELSLDKQKAMAQQNNQLVDRLSRLIDDMLDVSRIRTGKLHLDKKKCDLGEIIRQVSFRMRNLFEVAGMSLPEIVEREKVTGEWDQFRLEQVIGNLLTNTIRYGLKNPVKVEVFKQGQEGVFFVADQGIGIGEEDLTRIFDRYERGDNANAISGMGLGLFITKEIVEAHHGRIWVESIMGKGSTFFIALPIQD